MIRLPFTVRIRITQRRSTGSCWIGPQSKDFTRIRVSPVRRRDGERVAAQAGYLDNPSYRTRRLSDINSSS